MIKAMAGIVAGLLLLVFGSTAVLSPAEKSPKVPTVIEVGSPAPGVPDSGYALDIRHISATIAAFEGARLTEASLGGQSHGDPYIWALVAGTKTDRLGATNSIPTSVALFETSLASKITKTATTMTLVSATDKAGTSLASSTYGFIIDEGTASEEMVLADCTGTTCQNMVRGISPVTGTTSVASLEFQHNRGASVKITDGPQLLIISRVFTGAGTIPAIMQYTSGVACTSASSGTSICDATYVRNIAGQGAATSTESIGGIVRLATSAQQSSSYYNGVNDPTVLQSRYSTSTCQVAQASVIVASSTTGKLNPVCFDQAYPYNFTATTTIAASGVFSAPLVLNGLAYKWPSSRAASSTVLTEDGAGNLIFLAPQVTSVSTSVVNGSSASNSTTTLASVTLPANTLNATNKMLRVQAMWSSINGNNNCWYQIDFGNGTASTTVSSSLLDNTTPGFPTLTDTRAFSTTTTATGFSTTINPGGNGAGGLANATVISQGNYASSTSLTSTTYLGFRVRSGGTNTCQLIGVSVGTN